MSKRWGASLLAAVLLVGATGCQREGGAETPRPAVADKAITLRWWGAVPAENGPARVVENFNARDSAVQVEYIYYNNNDDAGNTRLDISLLSPGEVDVFGSYNNTTLSRRIESGAAAPLNSLLTAAGISAEELYGAEAARYSVGGNYYYLPSTSNNNCILYNQSMFDAAGIPRPTSDWTYEEFEAAARTLTRDGVYGYYYPAFDAGQPITEFVQAKLGADWMYTADGAGANIDNPDLIRAFSLYQARVTEGIEPDFVTNKTQRMTSQDMLLQGKAAMVFGPWILRYVKDTKQYPHDFVVGYASLPRLTEEQGALHVTSLTEYMSVSSNSPHAAAALEFIEWYITEGFDPMIENGKVPAYQHYDREEAIRLMFGDSAPLFDVEEARQVLLTPAAGSDKQIFLAAVEINQILTEEFERAFSGGQTPEDAVSRAQERAAAAIRAAS